MPLECTRAAPPKAMADESGVTDEELFLLVREGDPEGRALTQLVKRHESGLYGLLVHLTGGDVNRADDLFQETFLRAVRAARTFDPQRSFRTWLMSIAVNLVRDEARRRKVLNEVALQSGEERAALQVETPERTPAQSAERNDEAWRVRASLLKLTLKEREVVLLHFFQGLTLAEAADALTVPLGTVKSRLHGALTRLKGILEP
ncbi:MAG: sigma-70 family RNA polymerase sigma factor [Planctomycetota bacterium]|nr:sigma-70 family RNA polymerase sigma factor [Planctomycetota bacterium]